MLLLFVRRQERQCTCDVILIVVRANIGGFAVLGIGLKSGAIIRICEIPPLVGNTASLAVRGNIPLNINFVLSERVTEFSPVVRTQYLLNKFLFWGQPVQLYYV
jgi:hypothetical protein